MGTARKWKGVEIESPLLICEKPTCPKTIRSGKKPFDGSTFEGTIFIGAIEQWIDAAPAPSRVCHILQTDSCGGPELNGSHKSKAKK